MSTTTDAPAAKPRPKRELPPLMQLTDAAAERMSVVGYHFPFPATGRVERAGTGYRLVPSAV